MTDITKDLVRLGLIPSDTRIYLTTLSGGTSVAQVDRRAYDMPATLVASDQG